jgi:hypothetical protein
MSQVSVKVVDTSVVRKWKRYPNYKDSDAIVVGGDSSTLGS